MVPLVVAEGIRWFAGPGPVTRGTVRQVSGLCLIALAVGLLVALPGALVIRGNDALSVVWLARGLSRAAGMILVTPVVIALARPRKGIAGGAEAIAMVAATAGVSVLLYTHLGHVARRCHGSPSCCLRRCCGTPCAVARAA